LIILIIFGEEHNRTQIVSQAPRRIRARDPRVRAVEVYKYISPNIKRPPIFPVRTCERNYFDKFEKDV
jgi:hypothetical protein